MHLAKLVLNSSSCFAFLPSSSSSSGLAPRAEGLQALTMMADGGGAWPYTHSFEKCVSPCLCCWIPMGSSTKARAVASMCRIAVDSRENRSPIFASRANIVAQDVF